LAASSDFDLNVRLRTAGGRILLVPEITAEYFADCDLRAFWQHNFSDGVWATYVLKFGSKGWSWRHWVPGGFVAGMLASVALALFWGAPLPLLSLTFVYVGMNLAASAQVAARERDVSYLWAMPLAFLVRHLAHGIGALFGLALVVTPGVHWRGRRSRRV